MARVASDKISPTLGAGRRHLKHERLRAKLLGEMAIGTFRPGEALPSEHRLAEMMMVSRTTVRQTLGELEREGHVRRVQGKGTFVAERSNEEATVGASLFALVVPDVATGYHPMLVAGFDRAANEAGGGVIVCNSNNDVDKQANHLMRLIDQHAAGVLMNPSTLSTTPPYQIRLVQQAGIPVVLLHRAVPDVQAPVLELPGEEIGLRAGRILVESGHRRVACLASHRYVLSEAFERGLRRSLEAHGASLPAEMIDYGELRSFSAADYQEHELYLDRLLDRLLNLPSPPTALFASFDATAEIIYLMVSRRGIRVPEDLSIVCFGGARREGAILRRLTAVTVDEEAAAQKAVQLLVDMREGRRPIDSNERIELPLGFNLGETVGPVGAT